MSSSISTGGFGGIGGAVLGASTTAPIAAIVLPQAGLLPDTGSSEISILVITAAVTFFVMVSSRAVTRVMRLHYARKARL